MNEIDKFFGDLPGEDKSVQDIFNDKPGQNNLPAEGNGEDPNGKKDEGIDVEKGEVRKNRRHRRLEEQLQRERESNIALNERIRVLSEVRTGAESKPGEMPAEWIALYGNTPEAKTAWELQERLINKAKDDAKKEAIAEFQQQQEAAVRQQKEFETFIDSELENLEDTYDVDLTSDAPAARKARREFLELVQKVSPKDEQGNIASYADFESTFELYKTQKEGAKKDPTVDRQKEIAAKTMQESSSGAPLATQRHTPGFRGWQKDYGL